MRERDFRAERLLGEKDAQSKRRKLSFGEIEHIGQVVKENVLVVSFLKNILADLERRCQSPSEKYTNVRKEWPYVITLN